MAALAVSFVPAKDLNLKSTSEGSKIPGYSLMQSKQDLVNFTSENLSLSPALRRRVKFATHTGRLAVRARYSGRPSNANVFMGGFILGGLIVGALGCVYAPQIIKALEGTDRKDLMRKLPKFIYDEEKALEKTRKILTEKIAQLNSAIDDVSSQLRAEYDANDAATASEEVEAAM
ncbi:unnamed protein product [Spirodela intermedia]|uniref:Uncharacterized protein n=1 Tax=Spirodela intermedia TaxID=51605 RepID=A0A7I8IDV3_SPIIN|nr:unnamed protein product [Spirodela intermedia]CAA6655839.1 unnamed protein product [Spirodela intermedia]